MNIRILFYSLFRSPVQKSGMGPFFFFLRILQVGILPVEQCFSINFPSFSQLPNEIETWNFRSIWVAWAIKCPENIVRFGNRLHSKNAHTLQPGVAKKWYISKQLYSNMVDVENLKFHPQLKHGSQYMRAKPDVISSPGMADITKNLNFCILGIFL